MKLLYYVALPYTEEILNLITLFSIKISKQDLDEDCTGKLGLFIYRTCLALEYIDEDSEWLLDTDDAIQVLALYANKDLNSVCKYLNAISNKPFTAYIDVFYLKYTI